MQVLLPFLRHGRLHAHAHRCLARQRKKTRAQRHDVKLHCVQRLHGDGLRARQLLLGVVAPWRYVELPGLV
eukprot:6188862-Pleurochrysis_carterae.AAC.2